MWPIDPIAARQYRRGLRAAEEGDLDRLLAQFDPHCTFTFLGDSPLGADLRGTADIRRWFERFGRLLPDPKFHVNQVIIAGPPWRQRLAAHVVIESTLAGEPYRNQFAHFLTLRWGHVVTDLVVEDTQRWERACRRLTAAGVAEAAAEPLTPTP
jgi:ketosteroid isomerase-like protein